MKKRDDGQTLLPFDEASDAQQASQAEQTESMPEGQDAGSESGAVKARPKRVKVVKDKDTGPSGDEDAEVQGEASAAGNGDDATAEEESSDGEGPVQGGAPPTQRGAGPLKKLMDWNFMGYASYVIRDRAIPDLEDGLKPVQRRILHSLHDKDDGRFIKVANIVGHCMQYHPHGDASIADALVSLTNRRYLIEGQGNFGNMYTGDSAAASRYIECRLTELARKEIFNRDLTRFVPSYDGRNKEPVTLPSKLPLLLMLGADGIAVGLSTRILPHNFKELLEAEIAVLQKKSFSLAPDFQQGGLMDVSEYDDGRGKIRIRALIEKRGTEKLVITRIPFSTTTESLIATIEEAIRRKRVPVKAINDFTGEHVEVELVLENEANQNAAMEKLYAFTACEVSLMAHQRVIRRGRPADMSVSEILRENARQLLDVLKRELELNRNRLLDELHAKTLVQIFVENRIYKAIETCKTWAECLQAVRDGLMPFADRLRREITRSDLDMLLGIRIRRISLFDLKKNTQEMKEILDALEKVEQHLKALTPYAIQYLKNLIKQHAVHFPRLTRVTSFGTIEMRELTSRELEIRQDKATGYIGHAIQGEPLFHCSSLEKVVCVWQDGRYRAGSPPEKMFVGEELVYCGKYDRDLVMTVVYTRGDFTYIKRFTLGGVIANKDYLCTMPGAKIVYFSPEPVEEIYVKYKPASGQKIHQQLFHPMEAPVKGARAKGNQMTFKAIDKIADKLPRWWVKDARMPKGMLLK